MAAQKDLMYRSIHGQYYMENGERNWAKKKITIKDEMSAEQKVQILLNAVFLKPDSLVLVFSKNTIKMIIMWRNIACSKLLCRFLLRWDDIIICASKRQWMNKFFFLFQILSGDTRSLTKQNSLYDKNNLFNCDIRICYVYIYI